MEEEILEATTTAHGYLVSPLSENISETPEGFLVVVGCPVARTGWQAYSVKDLPQESARDLGVDLSNPYASIDLYRPAEEVFAPDFMASLNGKPITDGHPEDFVSPETYSRYSKGHIQNVRKGEQMEDGEWPLIADLVISGEPLVSKVRNKTARENSLGYDYGIRREGKKIIQCDMIANHNAVVPKGRAGDLIAITDALPEKEIDSTAAPPEPAAALPPEPSAGHAASTVNEVPTTQKEKPKVKSRVMDLLGRGLRALAGESDVSSEDLAEAALEISKHQAVDAQSRARAADAAKGKGKDEDDPAIEAKPDKDHEVPAMDAERKKRHDALDRMLDAKDSRAADADMSELKKLVDEFLEEEKKEPEHAAADVEAAGDPAELEALLKGEDASEENEFKSEEGDAEETVVESGETELEPVGDAGGECAHCGEAHDAEACPKCGCRDRKPGKDAVATDRAHAADAYDGARSVLKMMRSHVARVNDKVLSDTFNNALGALTRSSRATVGGHGAFAGAARARDASKSNPGDRTRVRAVDSKNRNADVGKDPEAALQAYYDTAHNKGGK